MTLFFRGLKVCGASLLLSGLVFSEPVDLSVPVPIPELPVEQAQPVDGLVDRTHTLISDSLNRFIYEIDDTLGGGEPVSLTPKSSARIRIDLTKRGNDRSRLKGSIKVKAVLPRSEKRLRLLISTEEDLKPLQENGTSESSTDGLSFALRFIRNARDNGYVNFDLGARWRERKVQMFGRFTLSFDYEHGNSGFQSKFTNSLYQYSASGFENRFRYDLSLASAKQDSLLLRGSTDILWEEKRNGALITETIGLYTDFDDKRSLAFEALGSYSTRPNGDDTQRYLGSELRFRFRHNIWRKWFYYEFWPGVTWSATDNYKMGFQSFFRVETVIGSF